MNNPERNYFRMSPLPTPKSIILLWLNIALSFVIGVVGLGLGLTEGIAAQLVILYTIITVAIFLWFSNAIAVVFENRFASSPTEKEKEHTFTETSSWIKRNRILLVSIATLLIAYLIINAAVPSFRHITNLIAFGILEFILLFSFKISIYFPQGRSAFIGLMILAALIVISAFSIEGFLTEANMRSILLFAAFLGIASIGQTLVSLLGGLDLSIPFVIGASNIGLAYLMGLGVPPWASVLFVILVGGLIGLINGVLSYRLQAQALILTLGMGFGVAGLTQILTSIGSQQAGNVGGNVPNWLSNLAAMNGKTFGLAVPPTIFIWILLSIIIILGLRYTAYGRYMYALGGNRISAKLLHISELKYWSLAFTISGICSAVTGCLLLGWSGGGFIDVGHRYLFMTLAAVVIGGTSLTGGYGGYGFTVIGVLVLQLLSTFLLGIGLDYKWQQFIFGLLIVPIVGLYSRAPSIRAQV